GALQFLLPEAGVARLDRTEQAFFRREQEAGAVDVDAAAFQNEPAASQRGLDRGEPQRAGDLLRDRVVISPLGIFRPGVEERICDRNLTLRGNGEDRSVVACPDAIGRETEEANLF